MLELKLMPATRMSLKVVLVFYHGWHYVAFPTSALPPMRSNSSPQKQRILSRRGSDIYLLALVRIEQDY